MASPIDAAAAAVLGAMQGLTEFLPVSSSGHVAMGALFLGIPDMPLSMVVVVHAGTLLATLLVLGRDVAWLTGRTLRDLGRPRELLETEHGRIAAGVVVATLPTAVIGLLVAEHVEALSRSPLAVGIGLLVSAGLVLSTRRADGDEKILDLRSCLLLGLAQGVAVLPGISRSGTTIAVAMLLGMRGADAFRFSFLLSLPAIAGALVLQLAEPEALSRLGASALVAGAVALATGLGALLVLRHVVMTGRLWYFALYLVPAGLFLILHGSP